MLLLSLDECCGNDDNCVGKVVTREGDVVCPFAPGDGEVGDLATT